MSDVVAKKNASICKVYNMCVLYLANVTVQDAKDIMLLYCIRLIEGEFCALYSKLRGGRRCIYPDYDPLVIYFLSRYCARFVFSVSVALNAHIYPTITHTVIKDIISDYIHLYDRHTARQPTEYR